MIAGWGWSAPWTAGFFSKWYLMLGALEQGWWVLVFCW